jgi:hypothetical protein
MVAVAAALHIRSSHTDYVPAQPLHKAAATPFLLHPPQKSRLKYPTEN